MNITQEDLGILCICAVRYALGRQTYMPQTVQEIIRANLDAIDKTDLGVIARDISEAAERNQLGHPVIDAPRWMMLLDDIRAEIERRKKYRNGKDKD